MSRGFALLAAAAVVSACVAPSGESKAQQDPFASHRGEVLAGTAADTALSAAVAPEAPGTTADAPAAPAADTEGAASPDADVDKQIQDLLGDPGPFRDVFDRLQQAVKADDRKAVAALVDYPLTVRPKGGPARAIHDQEAFVAHWDTIMTEEVRKAVLEQKYAELFVNWRGVMVGSGQVWMNAICQDDACAESTVRIAGINPDAP
ncbi:hypothetical protein [Pseudoxanthomonas putridarboris]|uniref:DUF4440 domain-containing protein n=1 Tax=Pseudoxanthomonas putridarboris TaxID=752605 RepID=A0ABU9J3Q8_9GAMM